MICPCEKKGETSVVDSRPTEDGTAIRRRRLCACGERFTTFERIQIRELMVIKKNGRKSVFDRDKLSKSVYIALKKRPRTFLRFLKRLLRSSAMCQNMLMLIIINLRQLLFGCQALTKCLIQFRWNQIWWSNITHVKS